jgi:N-acetylmuramoyl-L-alanine amidase
LPDNRSGWVSTIFVTPSVAVASLPLLSGTATIAAPQVAAPSTGGAATATVTGAGILNVRSGPGTDFSLLNALPDGQSVTLAGRNADATWLQVRLPNDQLGWVSAQFLTSAVAFTTVPIAETAVATESVSPAPNTGGATSGIVAVTGTLNVRFGPGVTFTSFATLNNGENVTLEGRSTDGAWIQIRLPDGRLGWVSSQYLSSNVPFTNLPVSTSANQ